MVNMFAVLAAGNFGGPTDPMSNNFNNEVPNADGVFAVGMGFVLVFVVVALAVLVFWVYTIIDAARRPDAEWSAINQNKLVWVLVLVGGGIFGAPLIVSLVYFFWPRPQLKAVSSSGVVAGQGFSSPPVQQTRPYGD